jgi:hypothetical protein
MLAWQYVVANKVAPRFTCKMKWLSRFMCCLCGTISLSMLLVWQNEVETFILCCLKNTNAFQKTPHSHKHILGEVYM